MTGEVWQLGPLRVEPEQSIRGVFQVDVGMTTIDFPDAVTGGLRRTTDALRAVLQRTRGDLTISKQQEKLRKALIDFEARMGHVSPG